MKNTNFIDVIVSIILMALMVGGFIYFIDLVSNVEKECTPSQDHQQIIEKLDLLIKDNLGINKKP